MNSRRRKLLLLAISISVLPLVGEEIKSVSAPSERGTIEDKSERVRGDSGKWRDDARLQVSSSPSADSQSLDDWADTLPDHPRKLESTDVVWLIYQTEQLDDNDRVWVETIERDLKNKKITVVFARATWQGNYRKNFTWYNATGIKLGPLPAGIYEVEWIKMPYEFRQFDDPAKRQDAWPSDLTEPGDPTSNLLSFQVIAE